MICIRENGVAAAIQTVYPWAMHQGCWVHKMRNILHKVRKPDYDRVKAECPSHLCAPQNPAPKLKPPSIFGARCVPPTLEGKNLRMIVNRRMGDWSSRVSV